MFVSIESELLADSFMSVIHNGLSKGNFGFWLCKVSESAVLSFNSVNTALSQGVNKPPIIT